MTPSTKTLVKVFIINPPSSNPNIYKFTVSHYHNLFSLENVIIISTGENSQTDLSQIMCQHKDTCEFLLPVFIGELLGYRRCINIDEVREAIHTHLYSFHPNTSIIRYRNSRNSLNSTEKLIIRSACFRAISPGHHHALVTGGLTEHSDLLIMD